MMDQRKQMLSRMDSAVFCSRSAPSHLLLHIPLLCLVPLPLLLTWLHTLWRVWHQYDIIMLWPNESDFLSSCDCHFWCDYITWDSLMWKIWFHPPHICHLKNNIIYHILFYCIPFYSILISGWLSSWGSGSFSDVIRISAINDHVI